jgi:hypothetical protein
VAVVCEKESSHYLLFRALAKLGENGLGCIDSSLFAHILVDRKFTFNRPAWLWCDAVLGLFPVPRKEGV